MEEGFCIVEMIFDAEGKPADYRFLEINPAFEKQTGLHDAEGKLMRELAPEHEAHWFEIYGRIALTGEPAHFINEARALQRWYDVYAYRIGEPEDRKVAIVFNDITAYKQAEQALREATDELEVRVQERTAELARANRALQEEVAERAWAEEAVRLERQRFGDVLDMLPAYVVLLTPDYHVPFANRFFRERFGESEGRRCYEYLFGRTEPCETCETYTVLKTMAPHHWEWLGPDGRNYDIYDFPFTDTDGSTLIMEVGLDITERKRAEEEVRAAWLYARSLLEASLDPLVTISPEGKITDVNEATIAVTGVSREELIGTDFSDYFTEPEEARRGYQQVFSEGSVTDYPLTIRHREGSHRHVLYNATLYRDAEGNVLGVFAAARDVTAQRQAAQYARSLLEASLDPLVTISPEGKITDVNEATIEATGVPREELIGDRLLRLLHRAGEGARGLSGGVLPRLRHRLPVDHPPPGGPAHARALQRDPLSRRGGQRAGRLRRRPRRDRTEGGGSGLAGKPQPAAGRLAGHHRRGVRERPGGALPPGERGGRGVPRPAGRGHSWPQGHGAVRPRVRPRHHGRRPPRDRLRPHFDL